MNLSTDTEPADRSWLVSDLVEDIYARLGPFWTDLRPLDRLRVVAGVVRRVGDHQLHDRALALRCTAWNARDAAWRAVAARLPRRLVMWTAIRIANDTVADDEVVPAHSIGRMLQRWET